MYSVGCVVRIVHYYMYEYERVHEVTTLLFVVSNDALCITTRNEILCNSKKLKRSVERPKKVTLQSI